MKEVSEEDKLKIFDMGEKLNYFLQKYQGYGLSVVTTLFYKDGKIHNAVRIDLGKVQQA